MGRPPRRHGFRGNGAAARDPEPLPAGEYLLLFDPLDGSSNIDINVSVGTIFSVLRCPEGADPTQAEAFMQPGTQQLAAGYAVYGPTTLLVLTVGDGVACFTLDREQGSFVLTQDNMQIPADTGNSPSTCPTCATGNAGAPLRRGNAGRHDRSARQGLQHALGGLDGRRRASHHDRGGIFMYPMDAKIRDKGGKLRLMYEANPMA